MQVLALIHHLRPLVADEGREAAGAAAVVGINITRLQAFSGLAYREDIGEFIDTTVLNVTTGVLTGKILADLKKTHDK